MSNGHLFCLHFFSAFGILLLPHTFTFFLPSLLFFPLLLQLVLSLRPAWQVSGVK